MTTATLSLADFLLARIAEDEAREVAEDRAEYAADIPDDLYVKAALAHDRLLQTQWIRLSWAFRRLGWALACEPPLRWMGFGWLARQRAADYADHEDYRSEWAPS